MGLNQEKEWNRLERQKKVKKAFRRKEARMGSEKEKGERRHSESHYGRASEIYSLHLPGVAHKYCHCETLGKQGTQVLGEKNNSNDNNNTNTTGLKLFIFKVFLNIFPWKTKRSTGSLTFSF